MSDGPTDRYVYRKKCFGQVDGINSSFKTFEYRRVTDFTTSATPLGVYVSGTIAAASADSTATGEVILSIAPTPGQVVAATYYYQWFLDSELSSFLSYAAQWLGFGVDPQNVPVGLQPSGLYYAGQEAYHKLAIKWSERASETYLLEDQPDPKILGLADTYRKMAEDFKKKSVELRDQYYTRQGQTLAPNFGTAFGAVSNPVPRG